jgi:hypothetical protein
MSCFAEFRERDLTSRRALTRNRCNPNFFIGRVNLSNGRFDKWDDGERAEKAEATRS